MLSDKELIALDILSDRRSYVRKALDAYFNAVERGNPIDVITLEEYLRRFL
jgi:hypothetical protein